MPLFEVSICLMGFDWPNFGCRKFSENDSNNKEIKNEKRKLSVLNTPNLFSGPYWRLLTVAVGNLTLAVSTGAIYSWQLEGCWLVCQAEQCGDAERCGWGSGWAITGMQHQASWYHLSVQWHSPQSHTCLKGIGLRVFKGSEFDWFNKRLFLPAFNLFTRARKHVAICSGERARDLPLGIWHGKNSPKIKE